MVCSLFAAPPARSEYPYRTSLGLWPHEPIPGPAHQRDGIWHIDLGIRTSCPKMEETKDILDRKVFRPLSLGVFGQYDLETPLSRRSDFRNNTLYLGVGRQESDWFIWSFYVGGGIGEEENDQWSAGRRLKLDFEHQYFYAGLATEIYPWKVPRAGALNSWKDRFTASRPFLALGLETGYVRGEGRGSWSLGPFRLIHDETVVEDWVTSFNTGLGWSLPISPRWSLIVVGDYRWHFYRPDEFNGFTLGTALRYNLP